MNLSKRFFVHGFIVSFAIAASVTYVFRHMPGQAFLWLTVASLAVLNYFTDIWGAMKPHVAQGAASARKKLKEGSMVAGQQLAAHAKDNTGWYVFSILVAFAVIFFLCYFFGSKEMPFYVNGWILAMMTCVFGAAAVLVIILGTWKEVKAWWSDGKHLLYVSSVVSLVCFVLSIEYAWGAFLVGFWFFAALILCSCAIITVLGAWKKVGEWAGKNKLMITGILLIIAGYLLYSVIRGYPGLFLALLGFGCFGLKYASKKTA